eukprot:CAMPEP_0170460598 /NCGR_PEP_ID=MMETSP0123-20130129/6879_1 /TAXON_ID=182087 /ORGANISM="Favella ehrenbergii, Strain Fehren 1" /LENGTH=44 /DNA_ID= /DNA_START= /DNA_END= /DNA_ORIENTATION=
MSVSDELAIRNNFHSSNLKAGQKAPPQQQQQQQQQPSNAVNANA